MVLRCHHHYINLSLNSALDRLVDHISEERPKRKRLVDFWDWKTSHWLHPLTPWPHPSLLLSVHLSLSLLPLYHSSYIFSFLAITLYFCLSCLFLTFLSHLPFYQSKGGDREGGRERRGREKQRGGERGKGEKKSQGMRQRGGRDECIILQPITANPWGIPPKTTLLSQPERGPKGCAPVAQDLDSRQGGLLV